MKCQGIDEKVLEKLGDLIGENCYCCLLVDCRMTVRLQGEMLGGGNFTLQGEMEILRGISLS